MNDSLKASIEKCSAKYSELVLIRAAIQTIPMFGSAIDTLLAGKAATFQNRRVMAFIETAERLTEQIEEEKISKEFLESEDFFTLFQGTMERVIRAQHQEKIELLSSAFLHGVTHPDELVTAHIALDTISALQPVHIKVLRAFDDIRHGQSGYTYTWNSPKGSGGGAGTHANSSWVFKEQKLSDLSTFEIVCGDLVRLNMLDETEGGVHPPDFQPRFTKGYRPTRMAEIILGYLRFVVKC